MLTTDLFVGTEEAEVVGKDDEEGRKEEEKRQDERTFGPETFQTDYGNFEKMQKK